LANEAKKPAMGTGKDSNAYSSTLFLPKTTFPIRANAKEREPELQVICSDALYKWQFGDASPKSGGAARKSFVLHDGPPYANGSLHMGHFLNKVLKDIVNRYKVCCALP
jgi:isoleucyl-tRNA synthetase